MDHLAFREGSPLRSPRCYSRSQSCLVFGDVVTRLNHPGTLSQPCDCGQKSPFWEQLQLRVKVSGSSPRAQPRNRGDDRTSTSLRDHTVPEPQKNQGKASEREGSWGGWSW